MPSELNEVATIKGGKVSTRFHEVGKLSVDAVDQKLNTRFFDEKITVLLDPQFSCAPLLMKNTCNGQIFPSICRTHVFLIIY